ncbi:BQ5605_C010g05995 [Microbotryum silenes-dioicae]|uniref:BQ5605_C010g05995 protein n=1 Tax=Microbotryum silenes-dioicae TaxID=796604 RepID=A0A2X0NT40_9BASI|nr:BQ5605_C010g05995 [Microbotryum silenes-dioicae]
MLAAPQVSKTEAPLKPITEAAFEDLRASLQASKGRLVYLIQHPKGVQWVWSIIL